MSFPPAAASSSARSRFAADDDARTAGCETLIDLLRFRAETSPDRIVYRFLPGDNKAEQRITYRELDRRARALSVRVSQAAKRGDRALLLVPPGLDYVGAYFGCMY